MIAERWRLLNQVVIIGFDDLTREIREGFTRVNSRFDRVEERLDAVEQRLDRVETRLDSIDAHLRRINPNGHQTSAP